MMRRSLLRQSSSLPESRQIVQRPTAGQIAFDCVGGFALPVICLYFDPSVFRAPLGEPLLGRLAVVAGEAIGLGWLSLSAWLLLRWPPALMIGLLAGGAIFATLLGLALLPFSLAGLFGGDPIGFLGLSPFVTAFVFWRNAYNAHCQVPQGRTKDQVLILAIVGLAISCGGPWAAHSYVVYESSRALNMILSPDQAKTEQGLSVFKRLRPFADYDRLVFAYRTEMDEDRRRQLATAYKELTGRDINDRLAILAD